jgi:hypothetical protein
VLKSGEF